MDGLIMMVVSLSLIFFAFSLRNFYQFLALKKDLKDEVNDIIFIEDPFKKKISRKEKLIIKLLLYADDFSAIGQRINFFSENHEVKKQLMQAGYPYRLTVARFQGLKIFLLIIGLIIGGILLIIGFPYAEVIVILLPLAGYMGAIWWLRQKAKQRQDNLSYQLPDFLDTISVTLQAGVGLDQALRDIVPYFDGPVKDEFGRFLQEIDVGVQRTDAYQSLLTRNDSKEFQVLIKSLIQGEKLGVPISRTFKHQAEEMRKIKKEKIKEAAAKASPKVTLITTFIVMPSALILIGGLMVMNMFTENSNLFSLFK